MLRTMYDCNDQFTNGIVIGCNEEDIISHDMYRLYITIRGNFKKLGKFTIDQLDSPIFMDIKNRDYEKSNKSVITELEYMDILADSIRKDIK